ncbi:MULTISPECIES: hypothetical protein [Arthrobacter]|uniref:Cobalamin-independent synthase, Catalytic domain n=2 Tax=Arthrobacter TaxID=1663 RepID=A0ABU9KMK3_9MICC|nr:hypothetical protein [Arthrobacter sp. YJM1]MDP5227583.1 hypothetical protein [Arthrobacter sp. YJM1]
MTQPQGAHLVGSINVDDAESTIRLVAQHLGTHLKRIPDGEVGERFHWIAFQPDRLAAAEGLERVGDEPIRLRELDVRPVKLAPGVRAEDLVLPPLGYADAALESWEVFSRLQREGVVADGVRFQVSLPTPVGVVGSFVAAEDRDAFEPVYQAALLGELERILDGIPHESLAIQWDAALEFAIIEAAGYRQQSRAWFEDVWAYQVGRVAGLVESVPEDVEVGIHLCYGDAGEKHFVEPTDTANLVRFANELSAATLALPTSRALDWIHIPVPIERDDDAYYAPLAGLRLPDQTEFYLGLVHREDGVEGAQRRISTALRFLDRFGVATECGFGRAPEGTTVPLFETHRAVAAAW